MLAALPAAQAQRPGIWQPVGPSQATLFTIELDPFSPTTAYAGTYFGGIYRTVDLGSNWVPVPGPFSTFSVLSIGFDPGTRNTYYAGTFQHGIFGTTDGGRTWRELNRGLQDLDVQSILVDPSDSRRLLAATGTRLHRSVDGGQSWELTPQDLRVRTLLADPNRRGRVYAATFGDGVWVSNNSGESFERLGKELEGATVYSLVHDRAANQLLAGTSAGAFVLNAGQTAWTGISYGQPPGGLTHIVRLPGATTRYMAASGNGVFVTAADDAGKPYWFRVAAVESRLVLPVPGANFIFVAGLHGEVVGTSDEGRTFVERTGGLQNAFVGALTAIAGPQGTSILAGTDLGVYRWNGQDSRWASSSQEFRQTVFELQPDPHHPMGVYAGTELNGVYRSTDGGATWEETADGIVPPEVNAIVQSTAPPYALMAVTSGGFYRSVDNGRRWRQLSPIGNARAMALDPANPGDVLVGADQGQVYLLSGKTGVFSPLARPGIPLSDVLSVAVAPGDKYYAVLRDGTVHATRAQGGPWFRLADGIAQSFSQVAVDPARANIVLLGSAGGGIYRSSDFGVTWESANEGLGGVFIFRIAPDPSGGGAFYAATEEGVFRSTDGGQSWTRAGSGLPPGPVLHLIPQGGRLGGLFASVLDRGVFRLADAAAADGTWEEASSGLPEGRQMVLGYNPADGEVIYASTLRNGIYRSDDAGRTWTAASRGMSLFVRGIAPDPSTPGRIYAASLSAGLFKSTDHGANWRASGLEDRTLYRISLSGKTLYAATALGVSRSKDEGKTWESLGQQTPYVFSLAVHPGKPGVVYLGSFAGAVYRSNDGGLTWEEKGKGLPLADIVRLAVDPRSGAVYAAAKLFGIYKSLDGGATWSATGTIDGFTRESNITALCVDGDGGVYTAGSPVGAFRSLDGGATWSAAISGIRTLEVLSLSCGQEGTNAFAAGTLGEGVFFSLDRAESWFAAGSFNVEKVLALAADPSNASIWYAGTNEGLWISRDHGKNWTQAEAVPRKEVASIAATSRGLYVAVTGEAVYRSTNQGETWTTLRPPFQAAAFSALAADESGVYAGTGEEGISRTTDNGATWSTPASPATVRPITITVASHPRHPDIVYAGTAGQGVIKSTDGGNTWRPARRGMDFLFVLALAIDPEDPLRIFAGTNQGGVFMSTDGGENWTPLRNGMFHQNVTSLVVDPSNRKILYAGCEGGGVFRMELP